jgi:hypothetical protein
VIPNSTVVRRAAEVCDAGKILEENIDVLDQCRFDPGYVRYVR